jgi:hypothetical protein
MVVRIGSRSGTTIHEFLAATPLLGGTSQPVLVDPRAKHEDDEVVERATP